MRQTKPNAVNTECGSLAGSTPTATGNTNQKKKSARPTLVIESGNVGSTTWTTEPVQLGVGSTSIPHNDKATEKKKSESIGTTRTTESLHETVV